MKDNDFIDVVDYTKNNLFKCFKNKYCLREKDDSHFVYFYGYLEKLNCSKIVIENQYVDRDFFDDFTNYYVRCFINYEKYCKRVHFFKQFDQNEFYKYLSSKNKNNDYEKILQDNYLGFIVIKQLPQTVIGRTALRVYSDTITSDLDKDDKRSIRCIRKYNANLCGIKLIIESLAFQEQDTVVAACATSAIWFALQKTAYDFKYNIPTLYEITTQATKFFYNDRPIPSSGLNIFQMVHAIRSIGLEPDHKEYLTNEGEIKLPLLNYCYSYLRSGIPVILIVSIENEGLHAITLTGYKLKKEATIKNEFEIIDRSFNILKFKGSRIACFYAHDDQIGPFSKINIEFDKTNKIIKLKTSWTDDNGESIVVTPRDIIVPVYYKIRVPYFALLKYINRLSRLIKHIKILPSDKDDIVWDIYLCDINKYKSEIIEDENILMKKEILLRPYPRFFWRFIGTLNYRPLFELLADATDMEKSFQFIYLRGF